MLKTSNTKSAKPKKDVIGFGDNKKEHNDRIDPVDRDKIDDGKVEDNEIGKNQKMFKSKKLFKSKKIIGLDFLTLKARLAFTKLRQVFVKALILYHFNPNRHI